MNKITKKVGAAILSASFFISAVFSLSACSGDDKNGEAGADGLTPFIGENGNWWIGEVDTGVYAGGKNGQNGTDGKDGSNGKDGKDGADAIAPKFLYNEEDGYLHISYDDGETWVRLVNISNIVSDGKDGTSINSCLINESGELVITYSDGNSENLGTIVAKDGKDGLDGANGKDGADGKDGANGKDGKDGVDGKDGKDGTDGVGIEDIGVDYAGNLTVILTDGTVLSLGNFKGADGVDGIDGTNGTNGKDGATPLVQINPITKLWEVSYDNGNTWESLGIVSVGPAGEEGVTPIVRIHNGYWEISYDNGNSWRSTDVKAEGTDGAPGEDGRGIARLEIIDNCLWVTYTDSTIPVNLGKLTAEATGGSDTVQQDVYTDALDFYPNSDGESYSVKIGNAIYMEHIVIPSTYNGKPVTGILPYGFSNKDEVNVYLKTVIIPDSIVKIGNNAFEGCDSLEYIFVPSSVTEIGEYAFVGIETVEFEIAQSEAPSDQTWNFGFLGCSKIVWKDENK